MTVARPRPAPQPRREAEREGGRGRRAAGGRRAGGKRQPGGAERRPELVGGVLSQLLDRLGLRERMERSATADRWDEIAGPHIARVTKVSGVRHATLFVEVAGAVWMTELNMMRRRLLERLNENRERGRIERIVFVQSEDSQMAAPRGDQTERGRG